MMRRSKPECVAGVTRASASARAAALCVLASACLLSGATAAQRGAGAEKATARVKGRQSVVVRERGRAHTLNVSKHADAARIEEASVLFLTRRGEATYLLLDVCGPSKVPPDDRQCGAGTECNVVWLKLDRAWRVAGGRSVRYESCWSSVSSEGPKVAGRLLTLALEDFRDEVRREVSYDADSPEAGLSIKESAIPKSDP
ncbi:MAG TPA: hypothetical protein VGB98_19960 [Pyrinomonadaceae bacterium]|jgi:hypothetical protein